MLTQAYSHPNSIDVPKIAYRTEIPKHHRRKWRFIIPGKRRLRSGTTRHRPPHAALPGKQPARRAGCADARNHQRVHRPLALRLSIGHHLGQRVFGDVGVVVARLRRHPPAAADGRPVHPEVFTHAAREQRGCRVRLIFTFTLVVMVGPLLVVVVIVVAMAADIVAVGVVVKGAAGVAGIDMGIGKSVVYALADEGGVGDAEVDGDGDDDGHEVRPGGAGEVGDVADEPDEKEEQRDAVGAAALVVLDQLGDLSRGWLLAKQSV